MPGGTGLGRAARRVLTYTQRRAALWQGGKGAEQPRGQRWSGTGTRPPPVKDAAESAKHQSAASCSRAGSGLQQAFPRADKPEGGGAPSRPARRGRRPAPRAPHPPWPPPRPPAFLPPCLAAPRRPTSAARRPSVRCGREGLGAQVGERRGFALASSMSLLRTRRWLSLGAAQAGHLAKEGRWAALRLSTRPPPCPTWLAVPQASRRALSRKSLCPVRLVCRSCSVCERQGLPQSAHSSVSTASVLSSKLL